MAKILVYRPLGEHPPRTRMGELELGKVHEIAEDKAAVYLNKGFGQISAEDAEVLRKGDEKAKASLVARIAKDIAKAAEARAKAAAEAAAKVDAEPEAKADDKPAEAKPSRAHRVPAASDISLGGDQ